MALAYVLRDFRGTTLGQPSQGSRRVDGRSTTTLYPDPYPYPPDRPYPWLSLALVDPGTSPRECRMNEFRICHRHRSYNMRNRGEKKKQLVHAELNRQAQEWMKSFAWALLHEVFSQQDSIRNFGRRKDHSREDK